MKKTETIHLKIDSNLKEQAEAVLEKLGLSIEKAITLFLTETIKCNRFPFELMIPTKEEQEDLAFASFVASINGGALSDDAKKLSILYSQGVIDYETAVFALTKKYKQTPLESSDVKQY